jgi:ATP-dependent helicase/nuclease subunit A
VDALELASLDLDALLRFWISKEGRHIVARERFVHRELPFTARFNLEHLRTLRLAAGGVMAPDFVVVQGVVDLALISPDGIEIVDFKTDQASGSEMDARAAAYEPQVRLYAAALEAIYGLPVLKASLHFLATGRTWQFTLHEI